MRERDLRFASWVISVTSVLYGVVSILVSLDNGYIDDYYLWGLSTSSYLRTIPFFLLIIFGIGKMVGITFNINLLKRVSIVGMMFCWGFVWTSSIVSFFAVSPNRTAIVLLPIIAITTFIAMRGDYIE